MFRSHAGSISFKMEHKGCSGLNLEVKFQNGTQRVFWCHQNTKGVLLGGIWGVRACSGCSGCPGEKTKHQKASFHSRKLKKGVQVKSEHKSCSHLMLEVYVSKWNTKGVQLCCH